MAALLTMALAACNNASNNAGDEEAAAAPVAGTEGLKMAYVEVDSLMSQYQFCKDYTIILTRKGENIQKTLAAKERALQAQASTMQKKYESGQFSSEAELQNAQQSLQAAQADLQALGDRLSKEFAIEQAKFNEAMRDSVHHFLRVFNKTKKYDYIISRSGDNLLMANPHFDITSQVVAGLNKRYKPTAEMKEMLKTE